MPDCRNYPLSCKRRLKYQFSWTCLRTKSRNSITSRPWPDTPGGRRRFLTCPVYRVLFQHAHRFLDGSLHLRIATRNHVLGPIFDINIGPDAFVLYGPLAVAREESAARCNS